METHQASENMKTFFEKLLTLKRYCDDKCTHSRTEQEASIWRDVFERLDSIIREKK